MRIFITAIIVWLITLAPGFAKFQEPGVPRVDRQFSIEKERRIDELENLELEAAFEMLASPEFLGEDEYLDKATYRTFYYRAEEAIEFVMRFVRSPKSENSQAGIHKLYMAKRIFQVFPDLAMDRLTDLYNGAGPKVKANVIYVIGQMADDQGQGPATLLTEALNDKTICQELTGESVGEPLRICDVAYNQLVLRYSIENVLRTIGTGHSLDERDHHIQILQSKLK